MYSRMGSMASTCGSVDIAPRIHWIRNQKVILDRDLASLYGIATRVLKQSVRRNLRRFPGDFMFQLSDEEVDAVVESKNELQPWMPWCHKL